MKQKVPAAPLHEHLVSAASTDVKHEVQTIQASTPWKRKTSSRFICIFNVAPHESRTKKGLKMSIILTVILMAAAISLPCQNKYGRGKCLSQCICPSFPTMPRPAHLMAVIRHHVRAPSLHKIVVIWQQTAKSLGATHLYSALQKLPKPVEVVIAGNLSEPQHGDTHGGGGRPFLNTTLE
eukprot:scaffold110295_cov17-Tisochrysis_lutea.AAC.1